jgi:arsenate reductase
MQDRKVHEVKMIEFYGYKRCSTSRKAEKCLETAGIKYNFIDITETAPTQELLSKIVKNSGLETKKAFNTSGVQYRELGMKDKIKEMSESQMLEVLAGNGKLCKRPMLISGSKATIGFKEGDFQKTWV